MSENVFKYFSLRSHAINEAHRAATPLERLFDLVSVIAIAEAHFTMPLPKLTSPCHRRSELRLFLVSGGHGHAFIFAAPAAVGSGFSVLVDVATDHFVAFLLVVYRGISHTNGSLCFCKSLYSP
ncbi:hypothetical protein [Leptothoe sp. PORK10 BA2]|uniref:hypothetical protein n=1 Tax=Leptothoe sp. PORK10 BA2 TaxID=3110254 RepID=UPI002B21A660|nr:hypothetical protein [Leptothoe sp. PORK10 BA2]MEA5463497.1 hypothetical protein [Leptothoe sp. PORK10 BA2]